MRAFALTLALPVALTVVASGCGVTPAQPPSEPLGIPFVVSDHYSPDGFFGDGETRGQVDLVRTCATRPPGAQGDCYTITYRPGVKRFAGIFWQHPHNDWGDRPGHRVGAGATRITLQARGQPGQIISVGAGQRDSQPLHDSFQLEEVSLALTEAWAPHEIPFQGMSYQGESGVIGAFLVSFKAGDDDKPIVFSLDDIRWAP
jgi:hypothetical protein